MAKIDLIQARADALIAMEIHRTNDEYRGFPIGGESVSLPLQSAGGRERFLIDLSRGQIDLRNVKMQNRGRQVVGLVRIDLGGGADRLTAIQTVQRLGRLISMSTGDKWEFPLPRDRFRELTDVWTTLEDFLEYCTVGMARVR